MMVSTIAKILGLAAVVGFSAPGFTAIKFTGTDGVSGSNLLATGTTTTTPSVFGGMAGQCNAGDINATTTCNSCAAATGLTTCNRNRINPLLHMRISFTSDANAGRPLLVAPDGSTVLYNNTTVVPKGSTVVVDVPWSQVCSSFTTNSSSTCDPGVEVASGSFKIGLDVNSSGTLDSGDETTALTVKVVNPDPSATGTFDTIDDCATNASGNNSPGICYFMAYPGDEKVFLEDIDSGVGFPSTTGGTITSVNIYGSTTGFITTPAEMAPATVSVVENEITNKIVDGLENGVPHYFRASVSDEAGNEMFFTSDAAITAECGSLNPTSPFDGTGGGTVCPFAAIPDEVVGLLTKNVNCFIATAAFGSPMNPLVKDFRDFRDEFLMPFKLGRKFVNWYYSWSPEAANWLRHHDWSKSAVRAALVPVWLGTQAIVWWPVTLALLLVFFTAWRRYKVNGV